MHYNVHLHEYIIGNQNHGTRTGTLLFIYVWFTREVASDRR